MTYKELAKLTGLTVHALRLVVSSLKLTGSIDVSNERPATLKAIKAPPMPGQTLIIREPMPALELDSAIMEAMHRQIDSKQTAFNDELITAVILRARANTAEKNQRLLVFLVNIAEVIRMRIATDELSIDDLNGDK